MAWSCALAAIGYAKQYLNRDSIFRKVANEAIYPFYLLHQPVILILGFFLIKLEMPDISRFIMLTISSFGITFVLYWFVVRPFNITRVIFGMKPLPRRSGFPHVCGAIYQPAMQAQDQYAAWHLKDKLGKTLCINDVCCS